MAGNLPVENPVLLPHEIPLRIAQVNVYLAQSATKQNPEMLRQLLGLFVALEVSCEMYGQNVFLLEVMISKALVLFQLVERQPAQATLDQEVGMVEREEHIRSFSILVLWQKTGCGTSYRTVSIWPMYNDCLRLLKRTCYLESPVKYYHKNKLLPQASICEICSNRYTPVRTLE